MIYRHLQAVSIIFSSYWQSYAYTTHINSSVKSLFLHKPQCLKIYDDMYSQLQIL